MSPRARKAESSHTELAVLSIKLPANHPIFQYPPGKRSIMAREWMERGRELSEFTNEIRRELQQLKDIICKGAETTPKQQNEKPSIKPDLFLDI
ncbi:MAG: hypothetical protein AB1815_06410 [Bacillota bacterium]